MAKRKKKSKSRLREDLYIPKHPAVEKYQQKSNGIQALSQVWNPVSQMHSLL